MTGGRFLALLLSGAVALTGLVVVSWPAVRRNLPRRGCPCHPRRAELPRPEPPPPEREAPGERGRRSSQGQG